MNYVPPRSLANRGRRPCGEPEPILRPAAGGNLKLDRRRDDDGTMPNLDLLSSNRTFRLVTRSDFDGLVCAALLKELGLLHEILFVHPKDVQDGKVELTADDITTNLPYRPEVALSFDHHSSEELRVREDTGNRVMAADADSAARVVYDYLGGAATFPRVSVEMMEAVDRADAAQLSMDDILNPQGWILLSFLMDPRTGLGRFRNFRISNYQLMMQLIDSCLDLSIDEILASPDVAERVALYRKHSEAAVGQILRCSTVHDRVVVLDLRDEEVIHPTNRFLVYALHPRVHGVDPRVVGPQAAEHGVRGRALDPRSLLAGRHRGADARARRRRTRGGRNLSGRQRVRRGDPRGTRSGDHRRRARTGRQRFIDQLSRLVACLRDEDAD